MILQRNLCIGFLFLFSIFVGANGFWGGDITSIIFFPFYYVAIYAEIKFSRVFLGLSDKYTVAECVVAKDPFSYFSSVIHEKKDFELNNGDEVKIVNVGGKLNKKRSILSKDHYKVVGYNGNIVKLKNMKNGNIEYRPRFYIQLNGKRNQ